MKNSCVHLELILNTNDLARIIDVTHHKYLGFWRKQ